MSFMLIGHASRIPPSGGLSIEITDMGAVYDTCTAHAPRGRSSAEWAGMNFYQEQGMLPNDRRQGRKSTRGYA